MAKGTIFNIQKFSIHDGPGIRTTVFLKGCPLRCQWCANPESQMQARQILCDHDRCLKCQTCLRNCPEEAIVFKDNKIQFLEHRCVGCLECVDMCPVDALSYEGDYKTVQEIVDVCLQDLPFYEESQGGVTISGGEGMMQPTFLKELIDALHNEHIHVAIETTGYIQEDTFQNLALDLDLILFDVKHYDSKTHFSETGVYNELILKNLKWAIDHDLDILVRIPVIPGFNDSLEDAKHFCELFHESNVKRVQLLPFHQFGENKYRLLNKDYAYDGCNALHPEDLKDYQDIFIQQDIDCFF